MLFNDRRTGNLHDISMLSDIGAPAGPGGGMVGFANTRRDRVAGRAAVVGGPVRSPWTPMAQAFIGHPHETLPGPAKPTVGRKLMRRMTPVNR